MLKIDRLHLTLPAAYAGRADAIARRVAARLAERPAAAAGLDLERLRVPPIEAPPGLSGEGLASLVADAIGAAIAARARAGR